MGNMYIEGLEYQLPSPFRAASERMEKQFNTDTFKDKNNAVYWKSNKQVPPEEVLDFWKYLGKDFNYEKSINIQKKQTNDFLNNLKKIKRHPLDEEELFEMKSAFGEDATVVDVITGQKFNLKKQKNQQSEKMQTRKVKTGKAKDYERNAKYFTYYFIRVNNQDYTLQYGGWSGVPVLYDNKGNYAKIEGVKYYLQF